MSDGHFYFLHLPVLGALKFVSHIDIYAVIAKIHRKCQCSRPGIHTAHWKCDCLSCLKALDSISTIKEREKKYIEFSIFKYYCLYFSRSYLSRKGNLCYKSSWLINAILLQKEVSSWTKGKSTEVLCKCYFPSD